MRPFPLEVAFRHLPLAFTKGEVVLVLPLVPRPRLAPLFSEYEEEGEGDKLVEFFATLGQTLRRGHPRGNPPFRPPNPTLSSRAFG